MTPARTVEPILSSTDPRAKLPDLSGILIIDKPPGMTSHDVVARVRRQVGMKRVGHGGTLDPFATGVLVVAVGRATRVLQYVQSSHKSYLADVTLGVETDSGDVDGHVTSRLMSEVWPTREDVVEALHGFVGVIQQTPPVYSAIKIGGRKLYEMARAGEPVEIPTRTVTVHSIDLLDYNPPDVRILVHCGTGTYVRSIARDLGASLGTGGYCRQLRRLKNGPFCIEESWTLEELGGIDARADWPVVAKHPDTALLNLGAVQLSKSDTESWYYGQPVQMTNVIRVIETELLRVYDCEGNFLGIAAVDAAFVLRPKLVMPTIDWDVTE